MPAALTQEEPAALDAGSFDLLLQKFMPLSPKLAVAVSGGPDSMALAYCVRRWGKSQAVALIVDHGLRPESAQEAREVAARLEQIGLAAEILTWKHETVAARLHEKARAARYRLLTEACRRLGAGDLLVAHHRDDQAETILLRLSKASGIAGLSGIAAATARGGVRILRPLLTVPKTRLLATCDAARVPYVADPSNGSEKFARGRLRKILPLLAQEGLTVEHLATLGERAAEAGDAIDFYARNFLRGVARFDGLGVVHLQSAGLPGLPRAVLMRALALCLRHIHDGDYPPERSAVAGLADAICNGVFQTARSLHGCLAAPGANKILFLREPAAAVEKAPIVAGRTLLWDGRWQIGLGQGEGGTIAALGNPAHDALDLLAPGLRKKLPQGRARAALPALWRGGAPVAVPHFGGEGDFTALYRKQSFP